MVGNSFVGNKSYLNIGKTEFLSENCYLFIKLLFIMCVCACIYVFLYWDVGPEDSKGCQKPRFTSCLSKCTEESSGDGCSMACDAEAPQRGPISRSNPGSGPAALQTGNLVSFYNRKAMPHSCVGWGLTLPDKCERSTSGCFLKMSLLQNGKRPERGVRWRQCSLLENAKNWIPDTVQSRKELLLKKARFTMYDKKGES